MEWQPIETAPKDGTEVALLYEDGRILSGTWERMMRGGGFWSLRSDRPYTFTATPESPKFWSPAPWPYDLRQPKDAA